MCASAARAAVEDWINDTDISAARDDTESDGFDAGVIEEIEQRAIALIHTTIRRLV